MKSAHSIEDAVLLKLTIRVRKRLFAALSLDVAEESGGEDLEKGVGSELISGYLNFKPLFNTSNWTETGTLTKRLCVAIVLSSGVGRGDFSINVVDGGHCLQLSVEWPIPLMDVSVMHRWKLANPRSAFMPYNPSVLGLEAALSAIRKRSSDSVESTARIPLPFAVSKQFVSQHNLSFLDGGSKMIYLYLKAAVVEEIGVVADTKELNEL